MNVYIFSDVQYLTNRYHGDGGLVIIAEDKTQAEELIEWANGLTYGDTDDFGICSADIALTDEDWDDVIVYKTDDDAEPRIFVFPDAGCC